MVADVLVIATLIGAVWWWQNKPRQARHARGGEVVSLLPYDDLPPIGAFDPMPEESRFDDYVEAGLAQLDSYLSGWDTNA